MNITTEIGNRIRHRRNELGFSQEQLAEYSDLRPSYIGQLERGEKTPSIETLYKITTGLQISLSDFMNGIEDIAFYLHSHFPKDFSFIHTHFPHDFFAILISKTAAYTLATSKHPNPFSNPWYTLDISLIYGLNTSPKIHPMIYVCYTPRT